MRISISPDAQVRVTVPGRVSLQEAENFVQAKRAWIQKHLTRIQQAQQAQQAADDHPELTREELDAAQDELFDRLWAFSQQYDLPYNRAAFRCQKTKWGSCSSQNNISLNINMVFLPRHLQDYLLLHELCHVRHKDHSKAFWTFLDQFCGGKAKQYAKEMSGYRMKIRR